MFSLHHSIGGAEIPRPIVAATNWTTELRQAFAALQAGGRVRVLFAERADRVGELGEAFNALAEDLERVAPEGLNREQAHRLRNRLASILAVVYLLRESGELSGPDEATLGEVAAEAQQLDQQLRAV
jgi:signal transduction histidine kinase